MSLKSIIRSMLSLSMKDTAAQSGSRRGLLAQVWANRTLYLIIAPSVLGMIIFQYYPAVTAFYRSFYAWDGRRATYVGIYNYQFFLEDPRLIQAWGNVLQLLFFNLIVLCIPLFIAYLIYRLPSDRDRYLYRVLMIIPMIIPSFVFIVLWRWIFSLDGALNLILRGLGLEAITNVWLGNTNTALYALMGMGFPWVDAIAMLIFLAGFMAIPGEMLDAAAVDGALGFKRFWYVELPSVSGQVKIMVILTIIGTIQDFGRSLWMTRGGPGWSTMVPGLNMYFALTEQFDYGYASAIGVVLFVIIFVFTLVNQRFIRGAEEG